MHTGGVTRPSVRALTIPEHPGAEGWEDFVAHTAIGNAVARRGIKASPRPCAMTSPPSQAPSAYGGNGKSAAGRSAARGSATSISRRLPRTPRSAASSAVVTVSGRACWAC